MSEKCSWTEWIKRKDDIVRMYHNGLSTREISAAIEAKTGYAFKSGTLRHYIGDLGILRTQAEAHALIRKKRTLVCEHCNEQFKAISYNQRWCDDCTGATRYKRRIKEHGLLGIELERMLTDQGNRCKICSVPFEGGFEIDRLKARKSFVIDHEHATGKVRGLLCRSCNQGMCYMDKPGWVQSAERYLEAHLATTR